LVNGVVAALVLLGAVEVVASEGRVQLRVDVPLPAVGVDSRGLADVRVRQAGLLSRPGQPVLPVMSVRLAVPPDAIATSVRVTIEAVDPQPIPGRFDVRPAPPMAVIGSREIDWGPQADRIVDGYDTAVYGASEVYPGSWAQAGRGLGQARRYRFATVDLYPVRYQPVDGTLLRATAFELTVTFERGRQSPGWRSDDCAADRLAAKLLDNYEVARGWYPEQCYGPPDGPPGVAIITTAELEQESDLLDDYIDMRTEQGYQINVATEAEWDFSTGDSQFDARADRIRLWLQENVEPLDLGWVLLIGNPDPGGNVANSIPMKKCGKYSGRGPTDFYYADISGDWDSSGNGQICEYNFDTMDVGNGVVDFVPELYVGRIPTYSDGAIAVDDILASIIAYEEETEVGDLKWRRRMMLPNSIYFFLNQYGDYTPRWDGATVGEWFISEQLEPRGMDWTTLYEKEGLDHSQFECHFPVDDYNTVDQWVRGYGFVFWTGHGSSEGVYRTVWYSDDGEPPNGIPDYQEMGSPGFMSTSYLYMIEEAPPPFVVHGSCSNGEPETASNLGYNLIRRGAIATVSASRAALTWHWPDVDPEVWEKPDEWDGDVIDIVSEYAVNVISGDEAGRAHGDAIAVTKDWNGDTSWYQKSIQNLYGDPLLKMVMCREDTDCENYLYCDGVETCDDGTCTPGIPIDCQTELGCRDAQCDEALGCVAGPGCVAPAPEDAGPGDGGAQQPTNLGYGSKSSCSFGPAARNRGSLYSVLWASF
jgi:hypothetical protein